MSVKPPQINIFDNCFEGFQTTKKSTLKSFLKLFENPLFHSRDLINFHHFKSIFVEKNHANLGSGLFGKFEFESIDEFIHQMLVAMIYRSNRITKNNVMVIHLQFIDRMINLIQINDESTHGLFGFVPFRINETLQKLELDASLLTMIQGFNGTADFFSFLYARGNLFVNGSIVSLQTKVNPNSVFSLKQKGPITNEIYLKQCFSLSNFVRSSYYFAFLLLQPDPRSFSSTTLEKSVPSIITTSESQDPAGLIQFIQDETDYAFSYPPKESTANFHILAGFAPRQLTTDWALGDQKLVPVLVHETILLLHELNIFVTNIQFNDYDIFLRSLIEAAFICETLFGYPDKKPYDFIIHKDHTFHEHEKDLLSRARILIATWLSAVSIIFKYHVFSHRFHMFLDALFTRIIEYHLMIFNHPFNVHDINIAYLDKALFAAFFHAPRIRIEAFATPNFFHESFSTLILLREYFVDRASFMFGRQDNPKMEFKSIFAFKFQHATTEEVDGSYSSLAKIRDYELKLSSSTTNYPPLPVVINSENPTTVFGSYSLSLVSLGTIIHHILNVISKDSDLSGVAETLGKEKKIFKHYSGTKVVASDFNPIRTVFDAQHRTFVTTILSSREDLLDYFAQNINDIFAKNKKVVAQQKNLDTINEEQSRAFIILWFLYSPFFNGQPRILEEKFNSRDLFDVNNSFSRYQYFSVSANYNPEEFFKKVFNIGDKAMPAFSKRLFQSNNVHHPFNLSSQSTIVHPRFRFVPHAFNYSMTINKNVPSYRGDIFGRLFEGLLSFSVPQQASSSTASTSTFTPNYFVWLLCRSFIYKLFSNAHMSKNIIIENFVQVYHLAKQNNIPLPTNLKNLDFEIEESKITNIFKKLFGIEQFNNAIMAIMQRYTDAKSYQDFTQVLQENIKPLLLIMHTYFYPTENVVLHDHIVFPQNIAQTFGKKKISKEIYLLQAYVLLKVGQPRPPVRVVFNTTRFNWPILPSPKEFYGPISGYRWHALDYDIQLASSVTRIRECRHPFTSMRLRIQQQANISQTNADNKHTFQEFKVGTSPIYDHTPTNRVDSRIIDQSTWFKPNIVLNQPSYEWKLMSPSSDDSVPSQTSFGFLAGEITPIELVIESTDVFGQDRKNHSNIQMDIHWLDFYQSVLTSIQNIFSNLTLYPVDHFSWFQYVETKFLSVVDYDNSKYSKTSVTHAHIVLDDGKVVPFNSSHLESHRVTRLQFIIRGFEINAQNVGNYLRYVRYTNDPSLANANFSPVERKSKIAVYGDIPDLHYWELISTKEILQNAEIVVLIPTTHGSFVSFSSSSSSSPPFLYDLPTQDKEWLDFFTASTSPDHTPPLSNSDDTFVLPQTTHVPSTSSLPPIAFEPLLSFETFVKTTGEPSEIVTVVSDDEPDFVPFTAQTPTLDDFDSYPPNPFAQENSESEFLEASIGAEYPNHTSYYLSNYPPINWREFLYYGYVLDDVEKDFLSYLHNPGTLKVKLLPISDSIAEDKRIPLIYNYIIHPLPIFNPRVA